MKINKRKLIAKCLPFLPFSFILLVPYIKNLVKQSLLKEMKEEEEKEAHEKGFVKVAIVEDKAYWIIDDILWQTNVVDGEIIREDAHPIDAFDIDFKELNKMMNILDHMQDWKN